VLPLFDAAVLDLLHLFLDRRDRRFRVGELCRVLERLRQRFTRLMVV
jgi:hypothetical protein